MPDASPSRVPARVLLYPLVGVLAVGNVVFALLWLLGPMGSGGRGERGGRRIAIRGADRALTVTEGAGGPTLGVGAPLAAEKFEMLVKRLARLAQSRRGGELARAYFESEAGRAAEPAVTIADPDPADGITTLRTARCATAAPGPSGRRWRSRPMPTRPWPRSWRRSGTVPQVASRCPSTWPSATS